jgi:hypothetical protein
MLTDEENLSLALWAAKTAFLSQRTVGVPAVISYPCVLVIPRCLRGLLSLPSRMMGEHPVPINGRQTQDWTMHALYEHAINVTSLIRSTCKISFRIGRLHVLVAYRGPTGLEPVGWYGVHDPVFPRQCRLWINAGFKIGRVRPRPRIEHGSVSRGAGRGAALHAGPNRPKGFSCVGGIA